MRAFRPNFDALEEHCLMSAGLQSHLPALLETTAHSPLRPALIASQFHNHAALPSAGAHALTAINPLAGSFSRITDRGKKLYPLGIDEHVRFIAKVFTTGFTGVNDRQKIDKVAQSLMSQTQGQVSANWDDAWYKVTLPDNRVKNLLLIWNNVDSREYGWVAIRNTPKQWQLLTSSGKWFTPGNGDQVKRTYFSNGVRIDLDILNPANTGRITPNDIFVSFGF
jgi:hypothetical protein